MTDLKLIDPGTYWRLPTTVGHVTIPCDDILTDDVLDPIGRKLETLTICKMVFPSWTRFLEKTRTEIDSMCAGEGYLGCWTDPRDFLVHQVGQSFLYDVPAGQRGHLAPFEGRRVRVACIRSGRFRRFIRVGYPAPPCADSEEDLKHVDSVNRDLRLRGHTLQIGTLREWSQRVRTRRLPHIKYRRLGPVRRR